MGAAFDLHRVANRFFVGRKTWQISRPSQATG
jgi:hypothetical protein